MPIDGDVSSLAEQAQLSGVKLVNIRQADGSLALGELPPINKIVIPKGTTKSATIRWLHTVGYTVSDIYKHLNVKYQMVRNIITTIPKRAAREDLAPLVVEYLPEDDDITMALDHELEKSLEMGRKAEKELRREELRSQGLID